MTKLVPLALAILSILLTSIPAFAQRNNQPLTEVAHDSTLVGKGTTASPLGIADSGVGTGKVANGAVTSSKVADGAITTPKVADGTITASKLGTAGAPAAGQILSFDGNGLAWQSASGPLRVVDFNNTEFGFFFPWQGGAYGGTVIRYVSSVQLWLSFDVGVQDFQRTPPWLYYESLDCTGTAYPASLDQQRGLHSPTLVSPLGTVYYRNGEVVLKTTRSFQQDVGYPCNQQQCGLCAVFPAGSFPLSDLGLTPPFKLSR